MNKEELVKKLEALINRWKQKDFAVTDCFDDYDEGIMEGYADAAAELQQVLWDCNK